MDGIKPYLNFNGNCEEAINYYKEALGGEVLFMQRYGEGPPMEGCEGLENLVMHTTLKVGDSIVMASDCPPSQAVAPGSNISLAIGTDSPARADEMFANLSEGGKVTMPMQETFWAQRFGMLTDKYGVNWMLNCEKPRTDQATA
jgi:PhnB protein